MYDVPVIEINANTFQELSMTRFVSFFTSLGSGTFLKALADYHRDLIFCLNLFFTGHGTLLIMKKFCHLARSQSAGWEASHISTL